MRLIDADAIRLSKGFFEDVDNVPKFYEWLSEQHTIPPMKHGRWIISDGCVCCSECGEPNMEWNYCPNCGARMGGGIEDETD